MNSLKVRFTARSLALTFSCLEKSKRRLAVFLASLAVVSATAAERPLRVEDIQARLVETSENLKLDRGSKNTVLATYSNALTWAAGTAANGRLAEDFTSAREAAPALILEISQRLTNVAATAGPALSTNVPLKSLEVLAATTEAELIAAKTTLATLRDEPKRRADRRVELAASIALVKAKLEELGRTSPSVVPESRAELAAATTLLETVRRQALEAELKGAEAELLFYDASTDLLTAQTDQAGRLVGQLDAHTETLRQVTAQRRRIEAQADVAEAERQRQVLPTAQSIPVIERLAVENTEIAVQRAGVGSVAAKIETASASLERLRRDARNLEETFRGIERRVQALERAGRSIDDTTGLLLRKVRATLPEEGRLRARNGTTQDELSTAQLAAFDLQDQRARLDDPAARAREMVNAPDSGINPARRQEAESAIVKLLQARRGYLEGLLGDYETYLRTLIELDSAQRGLIVSSARIAKYIDERVLWIRSTAKYSFKDFKARGEMFRQRFPLSGWAELGRFIWNDFRQRPAQMVLVLGLGLLLLFLKRRVGQALEVMGGEATQATVNSFRPTFRAMLGTLALSSIVPLLVGYVAWRLSNVSEESPASEFIQSVADGLFAVSLVFFTLEFYRELCRPKGLAEAHFGWSKQSTRLAGFHLKWLMAALLPLTFFVAAIEGRAQEATFGQFFFILIMICLAVFAHCLLRPTGGLQLFANSSTGRQRLARLAYLTGVTVPLGLGLAAWFGFYYTTLELSWRFEGTVWVILSVLLLNALILRWFVLARRRWAIEQATKRRAAQQEAIQSGTTEGSENAPTPEPEITLSTLDLQTRSLIRLFVSALLVLGLWGMWSGVFPALNAFKRVELWQIDTGANPSQSTAAPTATEFRESPRTGQPPGDSGPAGVKIVRPVRTAVTLADLFWVLAIGALSFAAIRNLPGLLELTVLSRLQLQPGVGYAISTVIRYAIALVGVIAGFGLLGVSWSKVQWLAAAISVGIGFGLQEIFANFISGLIILFERPIRLGDIVTVGEISGNVTRINIRATTITDFDRREFIVPNKEFVTGKLLNWTLTDPVTRVLVPVGIAYGSDVALAEKLLLKVAAESPYVMKDPAPRAIFWSFGDNSLEFRLYVHIPKRNIYLEMLHGLTTSIDREFRQAGINIAFPQRDVHLHAAGPLEVQLARKPMPQGKPSATPDAGKKTSPDNS